MPKFGYKGSETALNGLTNHMDTLNNLYGYNKLGSSERKYVSNLEVIVEFTSIYFPNFQRKKYLEWSADKAAKLIQKKKLFKTFSDWYKSYIINIKKLKS